MATRCQTWPKNTAGRTPRDPGYTRVNICSHFTFGQTSRSRMLAAKCFWWSHSNTPNSPPSPAGCRSFRNSGPVTAAPPVKVDGLVEFKVDGLVNLSIVKYCRIAPMTSLDTSREMIRPLAADPSGTADPSLLHPL